MYFKAFSNPLMILFFIHKVESQLRTLTKLLSPGVAVLVIAAHQIATATAEIAPQR